MENRCGYLKRILDPEAKLLEAIGPLDKIGRSGPHSI